MKKTTRIVLASAIILGGISTAGPALAATHTQNVTATCTSLHVQLGNYRLEPSVDKPANIAVITMDGVSTVTNFGASMDRQGLFVDGPDQHTYSVSVTANDDPSGPKLIASGTKTGCAIAVPLTQPAIVPAAVVPPAVSPPVVPVTPPVTAPNTTPRKGFAIEGTVPINGVPAATTVEPATVEPATYPAPVSTPNTVNGSVPESSNPTPPAPVEQAAVTTTSPDELAQTGANQLLYIWGAIGAMALVAGIISVVTVRKRAKA